MAHPTMSDVNPAGGELARLAVPGERLGWIFRDRNQYRKRFAEPPPAPAMAPPWLAERAELHEVWMSRRIWLSLGVGGGIALAFACLGSVAEPVTGDEGSPFFVFAVLAAAAAVVGVFASWAVADRARAEVEKAEQRSRSTYDRLTQEWKERHDAHDRQQQVVVDTMLEWGAATPSPGSRRVDIVGGTSWGWEAVLTVFGGSLLATRGSMTLVDFTGEALCGELLSLAEQTGRTVRLTTIPSQLDQVDFAAGLGLRELVDSLVESIYGDSQGSTRAERALDTMLLTDLCEALGGEVTMARVIAGLRVLTDHSGEPALTPEEVGRVLDLLPDEARRQAHAQIRRIEGFLRPLAGMGTAAADLPPATLSCLVADRDGQSAHTELLKDLIVQWLIRRVGRAQITAGSIVLLGADEVKHIHLERLTSLCERGGIRLVLFFKHLREHAVRTLGGGEVCFMRLDNHREAQQAAEFIGRNHTFKISQLTRALGGNETHTRADTEGEAMSEGFSHNRGGSSGRSGGRNWSRTRNWTHTRNWSQTRSTANGMNWSDTVTAQRVYEYAVEPRRLQDLPDYALLLVKREGQGSVVQTVECDPAITTLPRMTMDTLEYVPLPPADEALIPAAGPAGQVSLSEPASPTPPPYPSLGRDWEPE